MKYQRVRNLFCFSIFMLSIISLPLSAVAAIVHTELVFYDLATAIQRSYSVNMHPTSGGAYITLRRNDDKFTLLMEMASCFNTPASDDSVGYLWIEKREVQHADPALTPFLNFTQNNHLRVAMKPLANAQSLLLDKDSRNVLVVEPTMITLGTAGCQR